MVDVRNMQDVEYGVSGLSCGVMHWVTSPPVIHPSCKHARRAQACATETNRTSQADLRFSLKCSCERASNLSRSTKALAESEAQRATNQGQRRGSAFGSGAFALTLFDTPAVLDSNDVWAHLDLDSGALHMRGDCKLQLEATFPLGEVRRHLRITLI